jgi:murein L,D-transpeptidase YcbB/YkuD
MAGAAFSRVTSRAAAILFVVVGLAPGVALAQGGVMSQADGEAVAQAYRAAPEFRTPPGLDAAVAALASADPAARGRADAQLSAAARALAAGEHGSPANPASIDPDWDLRGPYDVAADFAAAKAQGRIAAWILAQPRKDQAYLDMVSAWRRYDAISAKGGWTTIPSGRELKTGSTGPAVERLRARLADEGYVATPSKTADVFDDALADAVSDFQTKHGIEASGVVDEDTIEALNVSAEDRTTTLAANLERARWLPDQFPPDRVEADVGAAQVTLFKGGEPVLTMRAVVGDRKHHTPIFVANVVAVVFNPPWVVPADIAKAELFPKAHRSPGYFARNDMYVSNGQIIQRAGPKSSLGRIKFDLSDPYAIYMHDTPAKSLFALDDRWRSHGCMRLQEPRKMAVALLASDKWDEDAVDAAIDAKVTKRIGLSQRLPIYVVYRTAEASKDAPATFREDAYGWDTKLMDAIKKS